MRQAQGTKSSTHRIADKRWLVFGLLVGALFLLVLLWTMNIRNIAALGLPGVVVLVVVFKAVVNELERTAKHTKKRAKQARQGAVAEDDVNAILGGLGPEYEVFADLDTGRGNINHVVVGPTGVFAIETKSHRGRVTIQGDSILLNGKAPDKNFLSQAWAGAYAVRDAVKAQTGTEIKVQPVLCFSSAFVQGRGRPKGVVVVPGKWLAGAIQNGKGSLGMVEVDAVREFLKAGIG